MVRSFLSFHLLHLKFQFLRGELSSALPAGSYWTLVSRKVNLECYGQLMSVLVLSVSLTADTGVVGVKQVPAPNSGMAMNLANTVLLAKIVRVALS